MRMEYILPLTIITPSYNRAEYLTRLHESLVSQTIQNFQWLIIDDGSTDDTEKIVDEMSGGSFILQYQKKDNGGKHTALNYAHQYIKGEMVCIVDSDDWLLPDAVEKIISNMEQYITKNNIKLMTFLRGRTPTDPINTSFPHQPVVSNHIDFRINGHRGGDCCEVIATEVLKEFPFPEHPCEKFLGEGYLWNSAGFKYDTVYIPEVIYICEYLEGGLTKSGRILRLSCPLGGMDNCKSYFNFSSNRKINRRSLRKEAWLYVCYGKFAGLNYSEITKRFNNKIIKRNYIFGYLLYKYWSYKYR